MDTVIKLLFGNSVKAILPLFIIYSILLGIFFIALAAYFIFNNVEDSDWIIYLSISMFVILLIGTTIIYVSISQHNIQYQYLSQILKNTAKGNDIHINQSFDTGWDEIKAMHQAILNIAHRHRQLITLFEGLGKKEFTQDIDQYGDTDKLYHSVILMKQSLKEMAAKDDQTNWVNKGLAIFADLLRQQNVSITELGYDIVSKLTKYIQANQARLYILNDEKPDNHYLELQGAYAYERKKHMEQKIYVEKINGVYKKADGLLGQVFLEKETIHITDVPQNYIEITSGLGHATPSNIIIVPIKSNDDIIGVIELASFTTFEKYQIQFVEKLGEMIASTFITMSISIKTKKLLDETQQQTYMLRERDEEMSQNIEEMSAIQEELERNKSELMVLKKNLEQEVEKQTTELVNKNKRLEDSEKIAQRKEKQVIAILNGIDYGIFFAEEEGTILICNEACYSIFGCSSGELVNNSFFNYFPELERLKFRKPFDISVLKKDKSTHQVELTINRMGFEGIKGLLFFVKEKTVEYAA